MRKLKAFNLAEILLALTIIMIISMIALPGLRKNVMGKELVAGRNKVYGSLKQSWGFVILDHSKYIIGKLGTINVLVNLMGSKLNASSRMCDGTAACFPRGIKNAPSQPKAGGQGFFASDGAAYMFESFSSDCLNDICAKAWVDTNGTDVPNTYGLDVFSFTLTPETTIPDKPELFQQQ